MMGRAGRRAVTSVILLAALWAATSDAHAAAASEAEQRACERNGGYWVTASGYCKIGA
jgi:hypothetical protein